MSRSFQPSFHRFALNLPESEPVRLLRMLADEIYRQLGGAILEEHLAEYGLIFRRWQAGADNAPGLREAMRAMGARERILAKLERLREQAWLQARAEVFQQTGARIPLPNTPESADRDEDKQTAQAMRELSRHVREAGNLASELEQERLALYAQPGPEPVEPETQTAPSSAPPTNKEIKAGIRKLIEAQVSRPLVEKLRSVAESGMISGEAFAQYVERAIGSPSLA